jgi:hypothetical protein
MFWECYGVIALIVGVFVMCVVDKENKGEYGLVECCVVLFSALTWPFFVGLMLYRIYAKCVDDGQNLIYNDE